MNQNEHLSLHSTRKLCFKQQRYNETNIISEHLAYKLIQVLISYHTSILLFNDPHCSLPHIPYPPKKSLNIYNNFLLKIQQLHLKANDWSQKTIHFT